MAEVYNLRRRHMNGAPRATHCAYDNCREPFHGSAWRGKSGALYCTQTCREWACDEMKLEDAARSVN